MSNHDKVDDKVEMGEREAMSQEEEAQLDIWKYIFGFVEQAVVKCGIELGIAEAIESHGGSITLSQLSLTINCDPSLLHRIMRFLTYRNIFKTIPIPTDEDDDYGYCYVQTPLSRCLMRNVKITWKEIKIGFFLHKYLNLFHIVIYKVNPMRMLGESISFGRFLSESMDWERWSTFTNKRYVEEAEKYSKPGSVAAKKAYFEAHYKRKAQEKAAALEEEANAQENRTSDSETREGNCNDTSVEKKSKPDHIVLVEQPNKDAVNHQVVDDTNQYESDVGQSVSYISNVEGAAEHTAQTCVDMNLNVENHVLDYNSSKEIVAPVEERISDPVNFHY